MLIGYARVSTANQQIDMQLEALRKAGCEKIFTDIASGAREERKGLEEALAFMREKDCLVVWRLDRLGRSLNHLISLSEKLKKMGVDLKSIEDCIDTSTRTGRFNLTILAAFAEMEREIIRERTLAGIEEARRQGREPGAPPKLTKEKLDTAKILLDAGHGYTEVARRLGVHRTTLYRRLPIDKKAT